MHCSCKEERVERETNRKTDNKGRVKLLAGQYKAVRLIEFLLKLLQFLD